MSKSPAALSGPLLFKRRRQHPDEASQHKTTAQGEPQNDGRTPAKRSFLKTDQSDKNGKHR
jgi:hypothetical protein